ncbi:ArnT family glycosyltransferase [Sphaerothrix gracilis]|uniref:ArnT family glycosyltransferase n=1 Tax=Sphaerothrix gracilis TaxID=3151835 RepID=UPI0031FC9366
MSVILKQILPLLGLFGLLRLIFWLSAFPNPDEAYYWLWGQHLDWSYYDHPPLQAWIQGLFTAVLGRSPFVLRLPNLLTNLLFFFTHYRICRYLYGPQAKAAFSLVIALVLASPLYFVFLGLAWHDHLLITFTLMAGYEFVRFADGYIANGRGESWRLYATGMLLGLAGLSKYNAVFVLAGIAAAIAFHPKLRKLLRDRRLYLALGLAAIAFVPVLVWNVLNGWQSFQYYATRSVDAGAATGWQIKPLEPLGFWLFSILLLSPVTAWLMVQVLTPSQVTRVSKTGQRSLYRWIALWIFAVPTVSLSLIALFSTALYYWNIMAYPLLFPLMPAALLSEPESSAIAPPLRQRRLFWIGQGYGLLLAALIVFHYSVLPISALFSREAAIVDADTRMLFGWPQVVTAVQAQSPSPNTFLATTDYRSASALAYGLNQPDVFALSDRRDQFDIWAARTDLSGRDALLLWDDWHPLTPELRSHFQAIVPLQTLTVQRLGIFIKRYYLSRGIGFKP